MAGATGDGALRIRATSSAAVDKRRSGGSAQFDHYAWGRGGDFVWMVLLVGVFWAFFGIWWR